MPNQRPADTRYMGKGRAHIREEVREGEEGEEGGTKAKEDPREGEKVEIKGAKESAQN